MQNAARLRSVTQVSGSFCQWKFFSHPGAAVPRNRCPCYPLLLRKGNYWVKQNKRQSPGRHSYRLGTAAESGGQGLTSAFADFSTTPWQGFEKSERGPNNSSLFQPLAAVVVVAVRILPIAQKESPAHESVSGILGAGMQSKSEPFPFDAAWAASSNVMVCVPSL